MSNGSTEIDVFIEAEFKKLVPYKPLTGPELVAIKLAFKEWLEQKNHKLTYLTPDEMKMEKEMVNLQVVLGLQSCKTKQDVCELLEDIRQHERFLLIKELSL